LWFVLRGGGGGLCEPFTSGSKTGNRSRFGKGSRIGDDSWMFVIREGGPPTRGFLGGTGDFMKIGAVTGSIFTGKFSPGEGVIVVQTKKKNRS